MRNKGFTLLEILIVVLIAGLMMLAVALRGGAQQNENAKNVAARLKSILIYAEQQAILHTDTIGFDITQKGYRFLIYNIDTANDKEPPSWQPISFDNILREYTLPSKIQLMVIPHDIHPAIIFFPSGDLTPFTINVLEDNKTRYQIMGEANGAITLK